MRRIREWLRKRKDKEYSKYFEDTRRRVQSEMLEVYTIVKRLDYEGDLYSPEEVRELLMESLRRLRHVLALCNMARLEAAERGYWGDVEYWKEGIDYAEALIQLTLEMLDDLKRMRRGE